MRPHPRGQIKEGKGAFLFITSNELSNVSLIYHYGLSDSLTKHPPCNMNDGTHQGSEPYQISSYAGNVGGGEPSESQGPSHITEDLSQLYDSFITDTANYEAAGFQYPDLPTVPTLSSTFGAIGQGRICSPFPDDIDQTLSNQPVTGSAIYGESVEDTMRRFESMINSQNTEIRALRKTVHTVASLGKANAEAQQSLVKRWTTLFDQQRTYYESALADLRNLVIEKLTPVCDNMTTMTTQGATERQAIKQQLVDWETKLDEFEQRLTIITTRLNEDGGKRRKKGGD